VKTRIMLAAVGIAVAASCLPLAPARAAGPCADLEAQDPHAYDRCISNKDVHCSYAGLTFAKHSTCRYPDGGRDECDTHMVNLSGEGAGTCTYFPPGAP
jgi:hypothetical protein